MLNNVNNIIEEYKKGTNLIKFLSENYSDVLTKNEITQLSYDIQAGAYTKKALQNPKFESERGQAFAKVLNEIGDFDSILEAGVGEATSMIAMLKELTQKPENIKGFDISVSRIMYGKNFIKDKTSSKIDFAVGDISSCPLPDNSSDLVYTIHALEPNGGNELALIKELIRVTRKYLVLFEPHYELGNDKSKKHIEDHNYVRNLSSIAKSLGHEVIEDKLIFDSNPKSNNNTGAIVVKKNQANIEENSFNWACPVSKEVLIPHSNFLLSKKTMSLYPVISAIPILLENKSILASSILDFEIEN
tara:strand:+ start:196 stop:1104 length:909 start_codon:yes stop_codon:yes gene_type:complete